MNQRAPLHAALGWVALAGILMPYAAAAQGNAASPRTRKELLTRLETDVGRAVANVRLSEEQKTRLTQARQVVTEQAANRRAMDRYEREQLAEALKQVRGIFKDKKMFQEPDRQAVIKDLDELKKARVTEAPRTRSARRTTTPYPRPLPYPRSRRW